MLTFLIKKRGFERFHAKMYQAVLGQSRQA